MVKRWYSVSVLKEDLAVIDRLVEAGFYVSRQEAIRDAIRHYLRGIVKEVEATQNLSETREKRQVRGIPSVPRYGADLPRERVV